MSTSRGTDRCSRCKEAEARAKRAERAGIRTAAGGDGRLAAVEAERDDLRARLEATDAAACWAVARLEVADSEENFGDDYEAEVKAAVAALREALEKAHALNPKDRTHAADCPVTLNAESPQEQACTCNPETQSPNPRTEP